jgi:uncharacterized surface protein with fasciclin (FAS1) repeats
MKTFEFTGFSAADLFGAAGIHKGAGFTMPAAATLSFSVMDDDTRLSGDVFRNERGDDRSGQMAAISRHGEDVGTGGTLYAENVWHVTADDGRTYRLVELEQPGQQPDSFTFLGAVPPAGVTLTVGRASNVFFGVNYADLSAGDLAPNIVEIATGSSDFDILEQALIAADLVTTVQQAKDITVFAPTDAAFTALAVDLGFDGDAADENAVFGFIAGALADLNGGDPISLLTDILLYHVSPGAKTAADVAGAAQITTLLDGATFAPNGAELVDNEPDIANPTVQGEAIEAANGNIIVIDKVLIPLDIPGNTLPEPPAPTIAGIVAASGGTFDNDATDFDLLLNAVQTAQLVGALDDPEADLTVFAPTDAAFVGLSQALGFEGTDEGEAFTYLVEALTLLGGGDPIPLLTEVLTYHVAPGAQTAAALEASAGIETLQGGTLTTDGTTIADADPDVPDPAFVAKDVDAANGIVQVIDGVLLPADLLASDGANDVDFVIDDDGGSVIRTGRDNDFVDGNGGNDFIILGKGNDTGLGGDGRDTIFGGKGEDVILGGADNDRLIGGKNADTFVFFDGDGHDRIIGFEQGEDVIDLSGTGFSSFEQIEDQIDAGFFRTKIDLADDLSITINQIGLKLDQDDFLF